jgi:16S rRNA (cytosine1402-N4)-methyltransferase
MPDHIAVLLTEAIDALQVQANHWYIDGTFGRGGHTSEILQRNGKVIAFDIDHEAVAFGQQHFAQEIAEGQLILLRENFDRLQQVIEKLIADKKVDVISGILFDFGTSSDQLKDAQRGFSFEGDAELDMRMDDRLGVKAKDLLAILPEKQLAQLFIDFGGEHEAKSIARAIVRQREKQPIQTTWELTDLISRAKREKRGHLHPATKVFQALRIAVNSELDVITVVLPQAYRDLGEGSNIVTISFHEGEDRIVKQQFKEWEKNGRGINLTKDIVVASQEEIDRNPRARSAKLRVFKKNTHE